MMTQTQEAKKQAAKLVEDALHTDYETLVNTGVLDNLRLQVQKFENDFYSKDLDYRFDESGMLEAVMPLNLPVELTDDDLIEYVLYQLKEVGYTFKESNQWYISQWLGETITINWIHDKNHYVIHCDELNLKVDTVENEDHAMLLIEQAMRKHGVFPNIVEVDYYGGFNKFVNTKMGRWKDKTINSRLKKYQG